MISNTDIIGKSGKVGLTVPNRAIADAEDSDLYWVFI